KELGNLAVHSHKPVRQYYAITAVKELFHVCFWLARTYARGMKPADGEAFNPEVLKPKAERPPAPQEPALPAKQEQLQRLETKLQEKDESLSALLTDKTALDTELIRLRGEIAAAKKANTAQPDRHNYSEAETRDY